MIAKIKGGLHTNDKRWTPIEQEWRGIENVIQQNTYRVVEAFRTSGLSTPDLMGTTGYGYDDRGRALLDGIVARIFGTEAGLIRPQWASGTHALATALKAVTHPGGRLVMVSGIPYDTLGPTLKKLAEQGVRLDITALEEAGGLKPGDVVYVQRSRGYSGRPSWGRDAIVEAAEYAHQFGALLVVDNCYGEFTRPEEPGHWGADLVIGSLMKNPGGTLAPTGAYAAGRSSVIEQVAEELFAPGIGGEVGATAPYLRLMAQGLFLAPQLVGEALMGGVYASWRAASLGIPADPPWAAEERNDIVVALELGSPDRVVAFCQAIQAWSPVDAQAKPEPWQMPGYDHPVIMAAGGFVSGGSLELSADAPIRPPYRVYLQGGVNRWHTMLAVDSAFQSIGF
ncbi:aluminum resistance protein [Sulfobacillus sp. DSM 109850]|uniref:Aluminum resistance protein n=1 Tax=Sulfobacillus harzensis TaxID=2729629 RepID=A0A7Y0Q0W7_9FIRM|nr:methionine gamma-lyase family protein [Sulfobacillus harzensis]NMP20837.1 aluminum resistance protein [Sulfobacillus harzensis]